MNRIRIPGRKPIYVVLVLWTIFTFFIAGWVLSGSLLSIKEMAENPLAFPGRVDPDKALIKGIDPFDSQKGEQWRQRDEQYFPFNKRIARLHIAINNYAQALTKQKMGMYFINSSVVTIISVLILSIIGTMAAYALTRWDFPLRDFLLFVFIAGLSIPVQILLVPLKDIMPKLGFRGGWVGEIAGLICVYVGTFLPFTILVMSGYLRTLPSEMEEAAALEGCGTLTVFWKIMFPLSMPGVSTAAILLFLEIWNEYVLALTLMVKQKTVSIGLFHLIPNLIPDWPAAFAGVVVVMAPVVVVFLILQERIVKGLTAGALKN